MLRTTTKKVVNFIPPATDAVAPPMNIIREINTSVAGLA
jgi:hypothetical protein